MENPLREGLNALRQEGTFCDVTLTGGGKKFRVHKNVISAYCGLFRMMFSGLCSETDEEIPVDRIDPVCLEQLIDFMYTGELLIDLDNAHDFLAAASFLQMEKLEEFCKQFLAHKLDVWRYPETTFTDHSRFSLSDLTQFRHNGTFCDVTLKVGERSFRVHKNVISSLSTFFKSICLETDKKEISLDDVDADTMELLIDYIYRRNLEMNFSNVKEILLTASRLQIFDAVERCCDFISYIVNVDNFVEYWDFSRNNSIKCLRDSLIKTAARNFPQVLYCNEIDLELEEIKQIIEMLQERRHSEDLIFSLVMHWINHSDETRAKHTNDLLEFLQPSLISPNLLHSLETINTSNPKFVSWANRSRPSPSSDETSECILISSIHFSDKSWKVGLFSQAKDTKIEFSASRTKMGSFICNGYYIYYQGGEDRNVVAESYVYHPTNRVWNPFVPLLEARCGHSSCVLNQKIFSVGGRNGNGILSSVEFTDLITGQRAFVDPMPCAKRRLGLGVHENSIYAAGGYSEEGFFSAYTHRFDAREGVWQSLEPSPFGNFSTSAAVVGESIYTSDKKTLHRYDIRSNQWESVDTQGEILMSGNVFSVRNTLYGLSAGYIVRFIPEDRRWVQQRTWTNGEKNNYYTVSPHLLSPAI